MADGGLPQLPEPDLRTQIQAHYGSLAKFAARVGMHKSTLGRVLAGGYAGRAAVHEARILRQLRVDGVAVDLDHLPALADAGLAAMTSRLDAVLGTLRLLRRASKEPATHAGLDLVLAEVASLRAGLGGREPRA